MENAALVLMAVELLGAYGYRLPGDAVQAGMLGVRWPGRFQRVRPAQGPTLLFDGAHNPQAMHRFLQTLRESPFRNAPKSFVFSAYEDKDYRAMGAMIAPHAERIYLSSLGRPRGASLSALTGAFRGARAQLVGGRSPQAAFRRALQETPGHGLVIVTGSLALVGRLIKTWMPPPAGPSGVAKQEALCA